jgi:hypothetical protein
MQSSHYLKNEAHALPRLEIKKKHVNHISVRACYFATVPLVVATGPLVVDDE